MADVTLTYKGSTIAEMSNTGSKTLKTSGKYCEGDIGVNYVKPSSGGSGFWDENTVKSFFENTLTNINIPSGTTEIKDYSFKFCPLTTISLPNSLQKIGREAFYGCNYLQLSSLPEGLTEISKFAFSNCFSFETIEFGANLNTIGEQAFYNCTGLTTVRFKGTPSTIQYNTFVSCPKLTDIYVPWAEGAVAGAPWGATHATIHYNTTT